jgi:sortase A
MMTMRRRFRLTRSIFALGALLFGTIALWQLGNGFYIQAKALLAQHLLNEAWARTVMGEREVKPWRWADTWPVARLDVPRLARKAIILEGGHGEALAFGPAHLLGTPMPGDKGTSVISGHRDTHFLFLKDLRIGDTLRITLMSGEIRNFRVSATQIVGARASGIDPFDGDGRLALVTCYPFDALTRSSLRYVIYAEPVENTGQPAAI